MSTPASIDSSIRAAMSNMEGDFNLLEPQFDTAILGLVEGGFGEHGVVCYDRDVALALMTASGMTPEEAEGFFYNVLTSPMDSTQPRMVTTTESLLASTGKDSVRNVINELDGAYLLLEPATMDAAIMGLLHVGGTVGRVVCYDREKVIEALMADGMDYDEAVEFYDFNIEGAYIGPETPLYITTKKTVVENYSDS